ncbi:hypothetical protein AN958_04320 [Leucoagaricus sp. SymC.cos]|nr:hypothetical protein AN958_04320 [Leucoagaricus sp. SymC.cos]
MPKDRARKLCPKFIGPYKVVESNPEMSNYKLDLPQALVNQRIHPVFHVSLLRPFHESDNTLFLDQTWPEPYDFGLDDEHEWFINEIIGHRHLDDGQLEFEVRWSLSDTIWEPAGNCADLSALDRYLELHGVQDVCFLRWCSRPSKKR